MSKFLKPITFIVFIVIFSAPSQLWAQSTYQYEIETWTAGGSDDALPLWLHANQWGVVDDSLVHAGVRLAAYGQHKRGNLKALWGANFAAQPLGDSQFSFTELYVGATWGPTRLMFGRWHEKLGSLDSILSTGPLGFSGNAIPLTRIEAGLHEFVSFPFLHHWASFKGAISHGWFEGDRVASPNILLHQKYLYIRVWEPWDFATGYAGFVHSAQWGGHQNGEDRINISWDDFWRVFWVQSGDSTAIEGEQINRLGNHLGFWDFSLVLTFPNGKFKTYYQHIFEDKSGATRWINIVDGLWGAGYKFNKKGLLEGISLEHLRTKWQSGPEPPDPGRGRDNYYNHYVYRSGWTHFGRSLGTPLFTPRGHVPDKFNRPLFFENTRVMGYHLGLEGHLKPTIAYRIFITYTQNFGSYGEERWYERFGDPYFYAGGLDQIYGLFELTHSNFLDNPNLELKTSLAIDSGEIQKALGILVALKWRLD